MPAPTYGVSVPDEYQSAVSPRSSGSIASSVGLLLGDAAAPASTRKIAPTSRDLAEHLVEVELRRAPGALRHAAGCDVGGDAEAGELVALAGGVGGEVPTPSPA